MEVDTCRESLARFCVGNGIDIGFGGANPIVPNAICIDRAEGHSARSRGPADGVYPTHLVGDAADLYWFANGTLDFVFSSHVLEDFDDTMRTLIEWARVLRQGGKLVLFLPDQRLYEAHSAKIGIQPNRDHKHADFSLSYVKARLPDNLRIIYERDAPTPTNHYSFELVCEKV